MKPGIGDTCTSHVIVFLFSFSTYKMYDRGFPFVFSLLEIPAPEKKSTSVVPILINIT